MDVGSQDPESLWCNSDLMKNDEDFYSYSDTCDRSDPTRLDATLSCVELVNHKTDVSTCIRGGGVHQLVSTKAIVILGGCFKKRDGPSDRATDHRPMLFVHSIMVRPSDRMQVDSLLRRVGQKVPA